MKSFRSTDGDGDVIGDGTWNVDWDMIETDPDGKSTGSSAPVYYPLESNDLFTPGWTFGSMVNGQYTLNVADGLHVPREYIWSRIETRHGSLGLDLAAYSAEASRVRFIGYSVKSRFGTENFVSGFKGFRGAWSWAAETHGTLIRNFAVYDNWAINWSIIPDQTHQRDSDWFEGNGENGAERSIRVAPSPNCVKQMMLLVGEDGWNAILELMNHPPLFDIEATPSLFNVGLFPMGREKGGLYFGHLALKGETVEKTFDRQRRGDVWTIRGSGVISGIYFRGSRTNFSNPDFLLHEVLHLIYPANLVGANDDLDAALVLDLNIVKDRGMSDSQAVSRYFQSGCLRKYGGIF